jgi:hypothetical protein
MQAFINVGFRQARRAVVTSLTAAVALLVFALPALPQAANGRVVGTVTDPGGAVIPGAKSP